MPTRTAIGPPLFAFTVPCFATGLPAGRKWGACMKWWFAIWIGFALFMMVSALVSALDLNWMGAAYLKLHHLIAIGTADFFATWIMLLVPPLVLWYAGVGILVLGRRAAIMLGLRAG